jgi:muconolactone delta-isomerase
VGGGGCSVMDVATAEELHEHTALCPIGNYMSFEIKPLIELDASFAMGREHLRA